MKRIVVALIIGSVLGVLFFVIAAPAGGACHCTTPTTVLFPYAAILLGGPSWESVSAVAMFAQFPLYSVMIGLLRGRARVLGVMAVIACHIIALVIGLKLYHR
jgi:hypothetical protein